MAEGVVIKQRADRRKRPAKPENCRESSYEPEDAPTWLEVPVYSIDWGYEDGFGYTARHEPRSTCPVDRRVKTVKFIPYGSTNLRLTELPFADVR